MGLNTIHPSTIFHFVTKRNVAEALLELTWVTDIRGALGWLGLAEYLEIWDILAGITLNTNEDAHI